MRKWVTKPLSKNYRVLAKPGIENNKDFGLKAEDIQKVKGAVNPNVCEQEPF